MINRFSIRLALLLAATLPLAQACDEGGGLKNAQTISSKEASSTVERTRGVEMIYSDSAKVRARVTAPLMIRHLEASPWIEWPEGVNAIFFDEKLQEQNRVKADYATKKEADQVLELRRNVVITTRAGDVYKSEQMFWNQNTRKFYSNTLLTRISAKGETGYAQRFESDENFLHPFFYDISGSILVPESKSP